MVDDIIKLLSRRSRALQTPGHEVLGSLISIHSNQGDMQKQA